MSLVQRLSEQLQQSLDANFKVSVFWGHEIFGSFTDFFRFAWKVTNVEAVLEIIKKLEGIPITKEQLEVGSPGVLMSHFS
jgi:hypothetical protein